jgi:hypothetical protein
MINIAHNLFFKLKKRHYGLGSAHIKNTMKLFGLPYSSWRSNIPFSIKLKKNSLLSTSLLMLANSEKFLSNFVLSFPSHFNLGLYKRKLRRLRLLKINRSLRGIRHAQCLPVNGQRTKTNARTQKLKRNR